MQVLLSDNEVNHTMPKPPIHTHSSSSTTPSAISSAPTSPPETPGFEPNTPAKEIPTAEVTVPAIIASLQANADRSPKSRLEDLDLPELDFSKPISNLLKVGTQRAHVQAENSVGAASLVKGELDLEEYIRWLAVLWRVYDALELGLSEHESNGVLAPTYDPTVLARADSLAKDISYLLSILPASAASSPATEAIIPDGPLPPFALPSFLAPIFTDTPAPLAAYLSHLKYLSSSSDLAPGLLAHSYVRYLGDLSGGQFIAARIKKAYNLAGPDGLRFYHFDLQNRSESGTESRAEGKKRSGEVKDWFRKGMDEGVGEDEDVKATLIREANLAFALNTHLSSLIRPPRSAGEGKGEGEQLRYYEKRALEKQQQQQTQTFTQAQTPAATWRETIEKVVLFGAFVALGMGLSKYGLPYVAEVINEYTGVKAEL